MSELEVKLSGRIRDLQARLSAAEKENKWLRGREVLITHALGVPDGGRYVNDIIQYAASLQARLSAAEEDTKTLAGLLNEQWRTLFAWRGDEVLRNRDEQMQMLGDKLQRAEEVVEALQRMMQRLPELFVEEPTLNDALFRYEERA